MAYSTDHSGLPLSPGDPVLERNTGQAGKIVGSAIGGRIVSPYPQRMNGGRGLPRPPAAPPRQVAYAVEDLAGAIAWKAPHEIVAVPVLYAGQLEDFQL